jgi:hypothetical protein
MILYNDLLSHRYGIMKSTTLKILIGTMGLLLIPFITMLFTDEVNWKVGDFAIMGTLLFGAGHLMEWIWRKLAASPYRWLVVGIIILAFLLIWGELAVGIFGTPFAGS